MATSLLDLLSYSVMWRTPDRVDYWSHDSYDIFTYGFLHSCKLSVCHAPTLEVLDCPLHHGAHEAFDEKSREVIDNWTCCMCGLSSFGLCIDTSR